MHCADTQSDVMFAHYAVRHNITYAVNTIAVGNITCPQGQTSFG
jgi:ABC-type molybdate transport system ATPase subunit